MTSLLLVVLAASACPSAGPWEQVGEFRPRWGPEAVTLPDGRVLLLGGSIDDEAVPWVDIYDPKTRRFTPGPSMRAPRRMFSATVLQDGRVLAVAGSDAKGDAQRSAEVFDPRKGKWKLTAPPSVARFHHSAALLPSGEVLVAGNLSDAGGDLAELYDPKRDRWTPLPRLPTRRSAVHAMAAPGGAPALVLGITDNTLHGVLRFSPATRTWTEGPQLDRPRWGSAVVPLGEGRVIVVGGTGGHGDDTSGYGPEVFDFAENAWRSLPAQEVAPRDSLAATLLPTGWLLVTGGEDAKDCALDWAHFLDPADGTTCPAPALPAPRVGHFSLLLPDGSVLVGGGANETCTYGKMPVLLKDAWLLKPR